MKKINLTPNKYPGKLIVFEGPDGSGKTFLLNLAKEYLEHKGYKVYATKMPSQRVKNLQIFNDFDNSKDDSTRQAVNLTDITIFVSGDRLLVLDTEIIPVLKQGNIVLCDRYCFTGLCRCDDKIIYDIAKRFIKPNLVILAQANLEILKQRVTSRQSEKDNFYDDDCVKKQVKCFNELAKKQHFTIINTEQEQNSIKNKLYDALNTMFNK